MMSNAVDTARDDLAYLRALVEGPRLDPSMGVTYFWGGILYGLQVAFSGLQVLGLLPYGTVLTLTINLLPTAIFLVVCVWIGWRQRGRAKPSAVMSKVMTALFGTLGATNLVFLTIIAIVSVQKPGVTLWLLYGCAVFVLQGGAWMVAWVLRRHVWLAGVGLSWFAFAIGMAAFITQPGLYVLICGIGLFACMAGPGLVLMRLGKPGV